MEHIPIRTCIATRKKYPKYELIRIACDKNGNLSLDKKQNLPGRGCYIFPDLESINIIMKKHGRLLSKSLRKNFSDIELKKLELELVAYINENHTH
ncbi:MAG: YlxR family protein [Candidatus Dojkabacteria bacterium]|nr:YlxR family protein [Candidatus Dojkabacteria bacterium]